MPHMPYKAKVERAREKWMTLPEAVTHICSTDNLEDEQIARGELLAALADGVLGPLRWEKESDDRPPPFGFTPVIVPTDTPPAGRDWLTAQIHWKTGRVRNDWGEYKNRKRRVLLVSRDAVALQWRKVISPEPSPHARSGRGIELSKPKVGGRPSARVFVFDTLNEMQKEGFDMAQPQKILADVAAKRNKRAIGDPGWKERTILQHVSDWKRKNPGSSKP